MLHDGRTIRLAPLLGRATVLVGYQEAPAALVNPEDVPDLRIPLPHHEYLKYSAASFLYLQDGPERDVEKGKNLMEIFNSLIGYA